MIKKAGGLLFRKSVRFYTCITLFLRKAVHAFSVSTFAVSSPSAQSTVM